MRRAGVVGLVLSVVAGLVLLVPATSAATALLPLRLSQTSFSPDGNGRGDTTDVFYRLPRPASVRFQVQRCCRDRRVLIIDRDLGRLPAGKHRLRWDGRNARGKRLPDNIYEVRVVARVSGGKLLRSDWVDVVVDTAVGLGELSLDWPAIYPRTTDFEDIVVIRHVGDWMSVSVDPGRVKLLAPDGEVVGKPRARDYETCFWGETAYMCGDVWEWTAPGRARALPPGRYKIVLTVHDDAGNRAQLRVPLRVSAERLQPTTAAVTLAAGASIWPPEYDPGCNGCPEDHTCGDVVAPGRFGAESLSYRSLDTCTDTMLGPLALEHHEAPVVPAAGYGPASVTFFGGPTTPGDTDQGVLAWGATGETASGPDTSDHATTSTAVRPAQPGVTVDSFRWDFLTRGTDSYDVAWFRLDYTYYAPPSRRPR